MNRVKMKAFDCVLLNRCLPYKKSIDVMLTDDQPLNCARCFGIYSTNTNKHTGKHIWFRACQYYRPAVRVQASVMMNQIKAIVLHAADL